MKNIAIASKISNKYVGLYPVAIDRRALDEFMAAGGSCWIIKCGKKDARRLFVVTYPDLQSIQKGKSRYHHDSGTYRFYINPATRELAFTRNGTVESYGRLKETTRDKYQSYVREWNSYLPAYSANGYRNSNVNCVGKTVTGYSNMGWLSLHTSQVLCAKEQDAMWIVDTAIDGERRSFVIEASKLHGALSEKKHLLKQVKSGRNSLYVDLRTGGLYAQPKAGLMDFVIKMDEFVGKKLSDHIVTKLS